MKQLYTFEKSRRHLTLLHQYLFVLMLSILTLSGTNLFAQENAIKDCGPNYFSAEITNQQISGDCIIRTVAISVDKANKYGLSHLVIEVPCGKVTSVTNSRNWPMVFNMKDPQTGKVGLKIDEISGFGDKSVSETFFVTYTICNTGTCENIINNPFDVVFKAATCQFMQTIVPTNNNDDNGNDDGNGEDGNDDNLPITELTASIKGNNILCFGAKNGWAQVTVSGGTSPYTYLWNNGATSAAIQDLSAGQYSVTVKDAKEQQITLSVNITEPTAINISASITASSCQLPTGSVQLNINGGTEPYSFSWSNGQTTSSLLNVGAGQYSVTIRDANDCVTNRNYTVAQSTTLKVSLTGSTLECHQEGQGTVTSTVTGGVAPYNYLWSNGQTTKNLTNVKSGMYQLLVTDSEGCTVTQVGYVTIRQLTASTTAKTPLCVGDSNGSATVTPLNGTAPYTYLWSNGETTSSIENLTSGWYFVDVTDANGCLAKRAVNVLAPTAIKIAQTVVPTNCDPTDSDVTVTLSATGGKGPYTWNVNDQASDPKFEIEAPQTINITVTDANGCTTSAINKVDYPTAVMQPTAAIIQPSCNSATGSATISATNAQGSLIAVWSDGYEGTTRNNLTEGEYFVNVTDAIGCTSPISFRIDAVQNPTVDILQPELTEICNTSNIKLAASVDNATTVKWSLVSAYDNWSIVSNNQSELIFNAGDGEATIMVTVTDKYGCQAFDNIVVGCKIIDTENPDNPTDPSDPLDPSDPTDPTNPGDNENPDNGDGDNDGGNNDGGNNDGGNNNGNPNNNCTMQDNFNTVVVGVETNANGCKTYTLRVITDGKSEHELSHLVIGIDGGTVGEVKISKNWKIVKNSTDPKSGVYGIKIDEINGFGQSGSDSFTIQYTVCPNGTNTLGNEAVIVYKAATCQWRESIDLTATQPIVSKISVYPNPFIDNAVIEIEALSDSELELTIFDLSGNKLETLYKGQIEKGMVYKFSFKAQNSADNLFFYQMITNEGIRQGKILKKK